MNPFTYLQLYLQPCYCCKLDFPKNIFLPLNCQPCSLFICVYLFSPREQIIIAYQNLAPHSNPQSCFTTPLHSVCEYSVLGGGLSECSSSECSSFLAFLLPYPSVSISTIFFCTHRTLYLSLAVFLFTSVNCSPMLAL